MRYSEGDWIAVPLANGKYALGLIARMKKGRGAKAIFGYFFNVIFESVPTIKDVAGLSLKPKDSVHKCRFGDLGLHDKSWAVIGPHENWRREDWPMPAFVRQDIVSKDFCQKITYSEDDPHKILSEEPCDCSLINVLPVDGASGSGAVERVLTKLLIEDQEL